MTTANAAKKENVKTEAQEQKPQAPMSVVKEERIEEAARKLTLEERIQKVEDLTMLISKLGTLNESRRKLAQFQLGADALSSTLQIRDGSGNTFSTTNSAVIAEVLILAKNTLDAKIREIETQITF